MAIIAVSGGHLTPALATIEELIKRSHSIIYVNEKSETFEDATNLMERLGVKVEKITTAKLHRHSLVETVKTLWELPFAVLTCVKILKVNNVEIVLSFGGYQSVPLVIASKILGIKSITHEQTLTPGLANKLNAWLVNKIAVTNEIPAKAFPTNKTVITGNPIRHSIFVKRERNLKLKRPYLYFAGGHLGSKALNKILLESLDRLLEKYDIVHAIGNHPDQNQEWEVAQSLVKKLEDGKCYWPERFFSSEIVASIVQHASLVISRSGANTCWELARLNKPCILIPLPTGQKTEQLRNAQLLEKLGLAVVIPQYKLSGKILVDLINKTMNRIQDFSISEEGLKRYYPLGGAEKLADLVDELCVK